MATISFIGTSPGGAKSTRYIVASSVSEAQTRANNMGFVSATNFKVVPKAQEPIALKSKKVQKTLARVGVRTPPAPVTPVSTGLGKQVLDSILSGIKTGTPLKQLGAFVSPQFLNVVLPQKIRGIEEQGLVKKSLGDGTVGSIGQFLSNILGNIGAGVLETPTVELGKEITGEKSSAGKALLEGILTDIAGTGGRRKELFKTGASELLGQYGRKPTTEELSQGMAARQRAIGGGLGFVAGEVAQTAIGGAIGKGIGKAGVKVVTPVLDDLARGFSKSLPLLERLGEKLGKPVGESFGQFLKRQLVDRFAPLEELVKTAVKKLPFEDNFYKKARLFAGVSGKFDDLIEKNLGETLKRESGRLTDLSNLTYLQRAQELSRKGISVMNPDDISKGISELRAKYGTAGLATLRKSAEEITDFGKILLKDMRDSGLISHTEFTRLSKAGEYWVPLEVVDDAMNKLAVGKFTGKSLNVSSRSSILTAIKGGAGEVRKNPLMTLMKRGLSTTSLAEKNRVIRSLAKSGLDVVEVKSTEVAEGLGLKSLSYFDDGIKKILAVPEPIEIAIKNLGEPSLGLLTKALTYQAKILRAGATALNIAFVPANIIRDVADALFTKATRDGIIPMINFIGNEPAAILNSIGKGKWYKEFLASGGHSSTLTSTIFRNPEAYVKSVTGNRSLIAKALSAPTDAIRFVARVGEESTRLAEYITQRKAGKLPSEAALAARDITVDFARSGQFLKVANQVIPFLNAGVQSLSRIATLAKNNPGRFVTSMGIFVGAPVALLYAHNKQFSDYDLIPEWEKNTSWIIMSRNRTPEETKTNAPIRAIKIPTGFFFMGAKVFLESALEFANGKDPGVLKTLARIFEVTSPASPSQAVPPGVEALGMLTGALEKYLFTGARVVPRGLEDVAPREQFNEKTPELFIRLGKLLNFSPAKLQATWETQTAGGGRMLTDILSQLLPRTLPEPEKATRSGELSKLPILGPVIEAITKRFYGTTPSEVGYEEAIKAKQGGSTRLLQERREARKYWLEVKPLPPEQQISRLKELGRQGIISEDIFGRVKELAKEFYLGITPLDNLIKAVSPRERAGLIRGDLEKLPDRESRVEYLRGLESKGILTESTGEELKKIIGDLL